MFGDVGSTIIITPEWEGDIFKPISHYYDI